MLLQSSNGYYFQSMVKQELGGLVPSLERSTLQVRAPKKSRSYCNNPAFYDGDGGNLVGVKIVTPHFSCISKICCQAKHKVFFWILLHDRLNIRNLLRRKKKSFAIF
jgi:hypothetical protein